MTRNVGNGVGGAPALLLVMLACAAGCGDNVVATRGHGSAGSSAGMVADITPPQAGRGNLGGGAGVSAGGSGSTPESRPVPPFPTPRYPNGCDVEEGCELVLVGDIEGREINHGYSNFAVKRDGRPDGHVLGMEGLFALGGYVNVAAIDAYEVSIANRVGPKLWLSGGLLRLPTGVPGEPGVWWCLDHGTAEGIDDRRAVIEVDAVSRLGSPADVERGDDWLQGTVNTSDPNGMLNGRFLEYSTVYPQALEFAEAAEGATRRYALGVTEWNLLAWAGRFPEPFREMVFITVEPPETRAVALAGPASTLTEAGDYETFDLSQISAPMQCPGTPVTGKITLHTNWNP